MRPYRDLEALYSQLDYFMDVVSGYGSDLAMLPELFNAPLMAAYLGANEAEAIRLLSEHTLQIREYLLAAAVKYNVNVICGNMPLLEGGKLYNVGYLCRRDGTYERYDKIHNTPNEAQAWGIQGGDQVRVFDTDPCRIGIVTVTIANSRNSYGC